MSLNDFCIPAKQMKFTFDVDNKNDQILQEFLNDQKVLCKLMQDMKRNCGRSLTTFSSISDRVKTILEQNGYYVNKMKYPYYAKEWTRISW